MKDLLRSIVVFFFLAQPAVTENWPGWRGDGTGLSKETGLVTKWSPEEAVLWRSEIPGKGVSSPIINQGRVFLTTAFESDQKSTAKKWVWLFMAVLGLPWLGLYSLTLWRQKNPCSDSALSSSPPPQSRRTFLKAPILMAFFLTGAVIVAEVLINVDGPLNYRFVTGSFSRVWLLSGLVASIALIAALLVSPPRWGIRIFLTTTAFAFALYFLLSTVNPNNWSQYKSHTIELTYASFGLVLGLMACHRYAPLWLSLGIGAEMVSLALVLYWHVTINHRFCFLRYRVSAGIIAGMAVAVAIYQLLRLLRRSDPNASFLNIPPFAGTFMALIPLVIAGVHFYSANFYLSKLGVLRSVVCLDARTGERLWREGFLTTKLERVVPASSYATPTPVTDGENVYAYFGSPGAVCYDYRGKRKWLNQNLPNPTEYGAATSPILYKNQLIIVSDNLVDSYVISLDTQTGRPLWRTARPNKMDSYGTPAIATLNGRSQLIVAGGGLMSGYDLADGKELWSMDISRAPTREGTIVVQSLVVDQEVVYVGGDYRNEKLTAYRLSADSAAKAPVQLWKSKRNVLGYASPLVISNLVFAVNDLGILSCMESSGGQILWQERLPGSYSASPFVADGKIYLFNDQGDATIVSASRDFHVIAKNSIAEACFGSPSVADGRIFVRTTGALWCIGSPRSNSPDARN